MAKIPSPHSLFQQRNAASASARTTRLTAEQQSYLTDYLERNKPAVVRVVVFMAISVVMEVSLPILASVWQDHLILALDPSVFLRGLPLAVILLTMFLSLTYHGIKKEKHLILNFINQLRHDWLGLYLQRPGKKLSSVEQGRLVTKLTYHLPLLDMGMQFALLASIRWALLMFGLLIACAFISPQLLLMTMVSVPGLLCFVGLGYIVSRRYVSREQTVSSRIIAHIINVTNESDFLRQQQGHAQALSLLDELVELDTFFRVRRALWMKFSNLIVFVTISSAAVIWATVQLIYPMAYLSSSHDYIIFGIIIGIIIQLLYNSVRIGMFIFPLQLGLFLCLPEEKCTPDADAITADLPLRFTAKQARIARGEPYRRRCRFDLKPGGRLLITGKAGTGRTTLAQIFAGTANAKIGQAWQITCNKQRYPYQIWHERKAGILYLDPQLHTELTVLQLLTGQIDNRQVASQKIYEILNTISSAPGMEFLHDYPKVIGTTIGSYTTSFTELGLLQLAAALIQKPAALIIDHVWLDLGDKRFKDLLKYVSKQLPDTCIVCFASRKNKLLPYDETSTL